MLDHCLAAMIPLTSEGAVYTLEAPDLTDDIRHNATLHAERTVNTIEVCLRFSRLDRCCELLSDILVCPGDVRTKLDLFYRPLARNLRLLIEQYGRTILQRPFSTFYRFLVGMYLHFYLGDESTRRDEAQLEPRLLSTACAKRVVCGHRELIADFSTSGDQFKDFVVTTKEQTHLRCVIPKLKDRVLPLTVMDAEGPQVSVRIAKLPRPELGAKEFLRMIGDEKEISELMGPLDEEALNNEEVRFPALHVTSPSPVGWFANRVASRYSCCILVYCIPAIRNLTPRLDQRPTLLRLRRKPVFGPRGLRPPPHASTG